MYVYNIYLLLFIITYVCDVSACTCIYTYIYIYIYIYTYLYVCVYRFSKYFEWLVRFQRLSSEIIVKRACSFLSALICIELHWSAERIRDMIERWERGSEIANQN
jgi:hypothetical protein